MWHCLSQIICRLSTVKHYKQRGMVVGKQTERQTQKKVTRGNCQGGVELPLGTDVENALRTPRFLESFA